MQFFFEEKKKTKVKSRKNKERCNYNVKTINVHLYWKKKIILLHVNESKPYYLLWVIRSDCE